MANFSLGSGYEVGIQRVAYISEKSRSLEKVHCWKKKFLNNEGDAALI
ncbi:hypothetical protein QS257_11535 [Terrilactibacillus sp. S3-3]|nr:hypothetical protein QS257_11535 [Terrilactibacillus sp. S3-3]